MQLNYRNKKRDGSFSICIWRTISDLENNREYWNGAIVSKGLRNKILDTTRKITKLRIKIEKANF